MEREALILPKLDLPAVAGPVDSVSAQRLLVTCGVSTARIALVRSADEAVAAAERLGYPVALKIESPDILHKTEALGVRLGLRDATAVSAAFDAVTESARRYKADAKLEGVLVQTMVTGDVEMVIGLQNDPVFGVVVMVGLT